MSAALRKGRADMTTIVASAEIPAASTSHSQHTALLTLGATGVVFGDIGTSPLYAMKECSSAIIR